MPARVLAVLYGGLLGNVTSENAKVLVAEMRNALSRGEANAALFNFLRTESALYPFILHSSGFLRRDYFPQKQLHWGMSLAGGIEGVYREMSGDHRKELRRMERKLLADYSGDIKVECLSEPRHLALMFRDLEEVAQGTYQRGLGAGFVDTSEMRKRFEFEAERGWLRSYILYVAGKPSAFWVGTIYKDTFHSGFMGYDKCIQRYSPGSVLQIKVLEDLCKVGVRQLDFGLGDAMYKQRFGSQSWEEASVYMFAPTLAAAVMNALRMPALLADRALRKVLSRTKLLANIKKSWRSKVLVKR